MKQQHRGVLIHSIEESRKSRAKRLERREVQCGENDITVLMFDKIIIREYPIIIGDNPAGKAGPSLSMDWEHFNETIYGLSTYEQDRPQRKFGREMQITPEDRFEILRNQGFSRWDIIESTKNLNIIREQRKQTTKSLSFRVESLREKIFRRAKDVFTGKKSSVEQAPLRTTFGKGRKKKVSPAISKTDDNIITKHTQFTMDLPTSFDDDIILNKQIQEMLLMEKVSDTPTEDMDTSIEDYDEDEV